MAGQKLKSARAVAVEVLNRCDPKRNYAGLILDAVRHETDQKQRATDLVFGTLRNRRAIDTVIATFSGRSIERIQGRLLNIIRVGTYELIYSPLTEQYAIVNEEVLNADSSQFGKADMGKRKEKQKIKKREAERIRKEQARAILACAGSGWYKKRYSSGTDDKAESTHTGSRSGT